MKKEKWISTPADRGEPSDVFVISSAAEHTQEKERWLQIFKSEREECSLCRRQGKIARIIITPISEIDVNGNILPSRTLETKQCYECFKKKGV